MGGALIITTMRNEAPHVLEWVAYHRLIGFDRFLVWSNDCEDGTDLLLDALARRGWLAHERNDRIGKKGVQWTALERAARHPWVAQADWLLVADCDEFVNIHAGEGRLADLLAAVPQADAVTLTWRLFGDSGVVEIEDAPTIAQFTRAAPFPCHAPWTASQFKTLYRNAGFYGRPGVHRPKAPDPTRRPVWVNGSGRRLPEAFAREGAVILGQNAGMDLVALNHYSLRSAKAFLVKAARGLPNRSGKPVDIGYWADRNFNVVEERSILRHLPALEAALAELRADPEIDRLHREGLAWHRARAEEALTTLEGLELFSRCVGTERREVDAALGAELLRRRVVLRRAGVRAGKGGPGGAAPRTPRGI
ncbi:Glycosyl transferase family 2 [Meinhardsimonia xiamenensis]|jgi:hypothetical protein|uniref:Glycosyl transferase family 2 n=1 Tax=Meinhardsimonia xiamenensis TaxID=990712 RepID=A0A1G9AKR8_9RHOB|nr:glycosyltransferase family 2 protein [Meinhardsimonia xiamenensis]PRX35364.1 glycosyl transferase family 2 [Meinhardsimonia xiamenensis]SDK27180.1 Glycosyl transferase family 2 [Meinhardsimonia xiamenensis]